jgi:hypothetical protein
LLPSAADTTAIPGEIVVRVHYSRIRRYEALTRLGEAIVHLGFTEHQRDAKSPPVTRQRARRPSRFSKTLCRETPERMTRHR